MISYATIVKRGMNGHEKNKFSKFIKFGRCWVTQESDQPSSSLTIRTLFEKGVLTNIELDELYSYKINNGKYAFFVMVIEKFAEHLV